MIGHADTVLLIGGGGFIGRHLARAIAARGAKVIAATRNAVEFSHDGIRNVCGTFDRPEDYLPLLEASTAVFNAASATTPGASAGRPMMELEGNLRPMLSLLDALHATPLPLTYLSSGGTVYGNVTGAPPDEEVAAHARSYYGAAKASAEQFAAAWAQQTSGSVTILRPSNVYGPGQVARPGFGIIPTAFECARTGHALTVWGDGSSTRDYLFIEDFVHACMAALDAPEPGTFVYNVGSGQPVSLNALLDAIDATTNTPINRQYRPGRTVDVLHTPLDLSSIKAGLGWSPLTSLDAGLDRAWRWFRDQA